jgi:hypothetical protein
MIQVESALRHSRTPSDHLVRPGRRRHGHPMIGSLAVTFRGKSPAGSWVRMDFCCTVVKRKFQVEDRTCARPQRRRRCRGRSRRLGRRHRRRRHPLPPRRTGAGAALARARRAGASTDPSLSPAALARGKRDGVVNRLLARPRLMLIKLVCLKLNLNRRHGHHCRQKPVPAA